MEASDIQTVEIDWSQIPSNLTEIYTSGMQYAMSNEEGKSCTPFCFCRDYFGDAVWATIHNKIASIYGFTFDPAKNPPLDMGNTRFLITNAKDQSFLNKVGGMLEFINQVEDIFDFRNTVARLVKNPPNKYKKCGIIETISSHRWMRSPVLLSIYTLFLRIGFVHVEGTSWQETVNGVLSGKITPYQENDADYLKNSVKGLQYIIKNGYKNIFYVQPKFNYPVKSSVSSIHNGSGIVAFTGMCGGGHKIVKHWFRPEIKDLEKPVVEELTFVK